MLAGQPLLLLVQGTLLLLHHTPQPLDHNKRRPSQTPPRSAPLPPQLPTLPIRPSPSCCRWRWWCWYLPVCRVAASPGACPRPLPPPSPHHPAPRGAPAAAAAEPSVSQVAGLTSPLTCCWLAEHSPWMKEQAGAPPRPAAAAGDGAWVCCLWRWSSWVCAAWPSPPAPPRTTHPPARRPPTLHPHRSPATTHIPPRQASSSSSVEPPAFCRACCLPTLTSAS